MKANQSHHHEFMINPAFLSFSGWTLPTPSSRLAFHRYLAPMCCGKGRGPIPNTDERPARKPRIVGGRHTPRRTVAIAWPRQSVEVKPSRIAYFVS